MVPLCKSLHHRTGLGGDEDIYMEEPLRYETLGEDSVKHLQKATYGLKKVRKWYDALTRVHTDISFRVSSADPGVFVARKGA